MANYPARYTIEVVDVNGDVAITTMPTLHGDANTVAQMATESGLFNTALAATTNSKVIKRSVTILFDEAQLVVGSSPPNNAEYSSVTDGARLQFSNNLGERYSMTVPAPLESDFGTSSNVVNSADTNVAALISFIISHATNQAGTLFNLYKGGIKVGRRARRRRSSLVP
jgi:hypothetical protein